MTKLVLENVTPFGKRYVREQFVFSKGQILFLGLIFLLLFFLSAMFNTTVFSIIATGMLFITTLYIKTSCAFQLIVFLSPSVSMVLLKDNTPSILGYIVLIMFIKVLITGNLKIKFSIITPSLLLILLGSIRVLSLGTMYDLSVYGKFIITIMLFMHIFSHETKDFKSDSIDLFIYGMLINLFLSLVYNISDNYSYYRFSSIFGDSNYTGVNILLSIILLILKSTIERKEINIFVLLLLLFFGLLTASRNFIFNFAFMVLLLLIGKKNKKSGKIVFAILFVSLFIYFLPISYVQNYKNIIIARILSPKDGDISGGRLALWGNYLEYYTGNISRILFGIGLTDYHIRSGIGQVAHNFFIGSIVTQGLIGFTLMINLYYLLFDNIYRSSRNSLQLRMIIISLFVLVFSYSTLDALGNFVSVVVLTLIGGSSSLSKKNLLQ